MFMRFLGGGIGHKATDCLQQILSASVPDELEVPDLHDDWEYIRPQTTQGHAQGEGDDDVEGVETH